jgi:hypothetical protein
MSSNKALCKPDLEECLWTALAGLLIAVVGAAMIGVFTNTLWRDDFQSAVMPGYVDMHRAIEEGSYPLISPYSWNGGRLGGEYGYGIFSVFHVALIWAVCSLGLTLAQTVNAIILIYLAVFGAGVFRLGRSMRLTRPNAVIAAFAARLNGWMLIWGCLTWIVFLTSCAWLGWTWWGLQIASKPRFGRWRFLPAGLFLYLLLTAAHPQVNLIAATITAWMGLGIVFARHRIGKIWRLAVSNRRMAAMRLLFGRMVVARLWPMVAAWGLGLALASPAILMLVESFRETARAEVGVPTVDRMAWSVPGGAYAGVFLPTITTTWLCFLRKTAVLDSFSLYGGFVPAVAFLAILLRSGRGFLRRHGWECALLLGAAVFASYGYYGQFRWAFKWLPLFHLALGLLGAHAIQEWNLQRDRCVRSESWRVATCLGCWGIAFLLATQAFHAALVRYPIGIGWLDSYFMASNVENASLVSACARLLYGLCAVWIVLDLTTGRLRRIHGWAPVVVMAMATIGPWTYCRSVDYAPRWSLDDRFFDPGPLDRQRLYFAFMSYEDVYSFDADNGLLCRFGNTPLYAGVKFVNGYTPMPGRMANRLLPIDWSGFLRPDKVKYLLPRETGPHDLLRQMGVDGIVLGPDFAHWVPTLERQGWQVVVQAYHNVVLHWPGPTQPVVQSITDVQWVENDNAIVKGVQDRGDSPAPACLLADREHPAGAHSKFPQVDVSDVDAARLTVRCRVANPSQQHEGLVAFSRAWYAGYRATLDGAPLEVRAINGLLPAVCIPPGAKGELVLTFAPPSVRYGLGIAAIGMLTALIAPWCFPRSRPRSVGTNNRRS